MPQKKYISHYEQLKDKWTEKEKSLQKRLWERHKDALHWLITQSQHVTATTAAGLFLLTTIPLAQPVITHAAAAVPISAPLNRELLIMDLYNKLPHQVGALTYDQADRITGILSTRFGVQVVANMNGKTLNTNYGLIGQEQHLPLYPGDNLSGHFDNQDDANNFADYGITPGLGAWGYFASSKENLTAADREREKWYVAVQTWLSPGYSENVKEYNDFFKYRKVLVVNAENGKAVVADIADAGPAPFTGKQYGGSPRVMKYLERVDGAQKGPVLLFFIDDPDNKVPLGPIDMQKGT